MSVNGIGWTNARLIRLESTELLGLTGIGGNRQTKPTATAPHLDSTDQRQSRTSASRRVGAAARIFSLTVSAVFHLPGTDFTFCVTRHDSSSVLMLTAPSALDSINICRGSTSSPWAHLRSRWQQQHPRSAPERSPTVRAKPAPR